MRQGPIYITRQLSYCADRSSGSSSLVALMADRRRRNLSGTHAMRWRQAAEEGYDAARRSAEMAVGQGQVVYDSETALPCFRRHRQCSGH
jgi:hypothetical protein